MMGISPVWLAFGVGMFLGAVVTVVVMGVMSTPKKIDDDMPRPAGPPRVPR